MTDSPSNEFRLSFDAVVERQAKREALAKELARVTDEIAGIDRWLEAVSIIFPQAAQFQAINSQADKEEFRSPLKRAILTLLEGAPEGLAPRDIARMIKEGDDDELRQRLIDNPSGHYNALERMCSQKQIIRYDEKYYTHLNFWSSPQSKEHGGPDADRKNEGMPSFVLSLFAPGVAMSPQDITDAVRADPVHSAALERNPGIVYSAISRLYKRNKLVRDGSYYVLPTKENEPRDGGTSHGSDAGSVFD